MAEVSLSQILNARDNRVQLQTELIGAYNVPVISFTMNIAGPVKNSPLIERAFKTGIKKITDSICGEDIISQSISILDTGCEAIFCVNMTAAELKKICETIENATPLGRLFDMDVIDTNGQKLSRADIRGCIVCGASGRGCAAGRLHSVKELAKVTNKIIQEHFFSQDKNLVAKLAEKSLIKEVYTTPKPGLVDNDNSGSHTDMTLDTFVKSANALSPYFASCFEIGHKTRNIPPHEVFPKLKKEGILAEEIMYRATSGVNTHKGIIYCMGIICAALGRLWTAEKPIADTEETTHTASQISAAAIENDFKNIDTSTAGGRYYQSHGIRGIRGEVLSGFLSVVNISLPIYTKALNNGFCENDAGATALIHLIANIDDTNLYHRGGEDGAKYAKSYAASLIEKTSSISSEDIKKMDEEFIKRNLSPGGCADLLAVTYFFAELKKHCI